MQSSMNSGYSSNRCTKYLLLAWWSENRRALWFKNIYNIDEYS